MRFYNRQDEIQTLTKMKLLSSDSSKMSTLFGRRRIGKTRLIRKVFQENKFLYFFVAKKDEKLLCEEFTSIIESTLDVKILGTIEHFAQLFEYIMKLAQKQMFTLSIDEFQEFFYINKSIYSQMQRIWDQYKENSRLNLILSGSVHSLMKKIFEDSKEPLFGRTNKKIFLKPFNVNTLKEIMADFQPGYSVEDLLFFYLLTGGVAKYIELLVDENNLTFNSILDAVVQENSYFLTEGKDVLIEAFGKDYRTYFSILSLIASSKTSRSEIESILEKNTGGYLNRLEKEYDIIKKIKPLFAKPGSRKQKYFINDNFLNFWFRFIYKNKSAVEIENFQYIKSIIKRDFTTYAGRFLEKYFIEKMKALNKYSHIGTYWEKDNTNEIDIVAANEMEKKIVFADVKINKKKLNLRFLEKKSKSLLSKSKFKGWDVEYMGLSIEDM